MYIVRSVFVHSAVIPILQLKKHETSKRVFLLSVNGWFTVYVMVSLRRMYFWRPSLLLQSIRNFSKCNREFHR
jgi:hypothetical protein